MAGAMSSNLFVLGVIFVCLLWQVRVAAAGVCPRSSSDGHGYWEEQFKSGQRCVLRCNEGFEPSGCNVMRPDKNGIWNQADAPSCIKVSVWSWLSFKTLLVGGILTVVILVVFQRFLWLLGFGTVGVTALSIAAWLQGPATVAGSWFALAQSAGAVGFAASTKAIVFAVMSFLTKLVMYCISECEAE